MSVLRRGDVLDMLPARGQPRASIPGPSIATSLPHLAHPDPAALHEISTLLNTGLDKQTLAIIVSLCENGVNPEALAAVIQEMRREAAAAEGDSDVTAR